MPGLIVLVMTLIGAFLTSLVMAREWERGTLEVAVRHAGAAAGDDAREADAVLRRRHDRSRRCACWQRGSCSGCRCAARCWSSSLPRCCTCWCRWGWDCSFRRSTRNQFLASQIALVASFMPALMLSGFIFDLRNVPVGDPGDRARAAGDLLHGADQDLVSCRRQLAADPATASAILPYTLRV